MPYDMRGWEPHQAFVALVQLPSKSVPSILGLGEKEKMCNFCTNCA